MVALRITKRQIFHVGSLLGLVLALAAAQAAGAQQTDDQGYPPPPQTQDSGSDAAAVSPSADPPSRVARLSIAQGNVSLEPASVNDFSPAELNDPLTTGDRLWADNGAQAELEAGQLAVRLGESTDLTVTAMTDTLAQFGLGQGSVHLRSFALDDGTTTELDTPNVSVTVLQPGDVRVDVDPNSDTTIVTLIAGEAEVDGNGLQQTLEAGQRVRFAGTDPVSAQWMQTAAADGLDSFSAQRDQVYEGDENAEQGDLNADTVGGADLAQYGSWTQDVDDGPVWYPSGVAANWQPYCYGHWTWVAPWGWTWIESEPWGFAPFHYGRWAQFGSRWGWVPGPPVVHPVYAPALVVFVNGGKGISAWFPLGPKEPYAPWYHTSVQYRNRVNVSNIYNRNAPEVRAAYATSNREVYANPLAGQQRWSNRSRATVAVPQESFAGGRAAARTRVNLPSAQLAGAAVLPHPMVSPERSMVVPSAARAVPPHTLRPTLASREDTAVRAGAPGTRPVQPAAAPGSRPAAPVERRGFTPGQPASATQPQRNPPAQRPAYNQPASNQPERNQPAANQPAQQPERGQPTQRPAYSQPAAQPGAIQGGVRMPNPVGGTEQLPAANNATPAEQRPLYNRAVPPPARPSFDQQRQAIQNTDPGRPLSPQQLNNVRDNRPAGQPQEREPAPHPAPQPRSEPAPQQRSAPAPSPRSAPEPAGRSSSPPPTPHSDSKR